MLPSKTVFAWYPRQLWRIDTWLEPAGWVWLRRVVLRESMWHGWIAFESDNR